MKTKNGKGFTLIELLAVVMIIAILVAIGLPAYQRAVLKSHTAEVNNLLTMVRTRQAREFALNKKYAESFNNTTLSQLTLHSTEVNNDLTKIVNDDYELELRNVPATEDTPASNCIIGRYKPDSDTKFTLAIAYTKNGLACEDGNINWSVCNSLGNAVVSNSIDEVCAGEAAGQTTCPNECGQCYYQNPDTCDCIENTEFLSTIGNSNWEFNASVGEAQGCKACKYCEGEDCPTEKRVLWEVDTTTHTINAFPATINDDTFECTNPDAALGDLTEIGCALYDVEDDNQRCLTPTYRCHSAYFKVWNTEPNCGWVCQAPADTSTICNGEQVWNSNTCSCTCKPGTRCLCHITQQYIGGSTQDCRCLAPEADFISKDEDPGCLCSARPTLGENQGDRVLTADKTHCKCGTSRQEVFFGSLTDPRGAVHDINIADWELYIEENRYWEAACCLHEEVWSADQIKDFDYDACCPIVKNGYTEESNINDIHLAFNSLQKQCCSTSEPFYNDEATDAVQFDIKSQYSNKPAGTYQTKICHQCREWYQAYNEEIGCHTCPGKTFTTWNNSTKVSECFCPTGTRGEPVVIENGIATETCECIKDNTHWDTSVQWISNPDTRTAWHVNNGACKCNKGFFDTYYGLEISDATAEGREFIGGTQNVGNKVDLGNSSSRSQSGSEGRVSNVNIGGRISYDDGFCCPNGYKTPVIDASNKDTGEKACCPTNKPFFHKTSFANNTCGVCQDHTHTYINGKCRACPAGMVPVYNEELGYALCDCPTGTTAIAGNNVPLATATNVCECNLTNATWQSPSEDWITPYINNQTMPGNWSTINGYCACNSNFTFTDHGIVGNTTITESGYCCATEMPANGLGGRVSEMWHASNANPPENFCCNNDVAFNPESPNAQCCTTRYYYATSVLNNATNNLNATIGGCGACSDPRQTWTQEDQCQDCEYPKIPTWNNSPSFGYSTCSCPPGSQEVQEITPPSWWESFLSLLGLGGTHQHVSLTAVLGHCQCVDENSVWVNGVCQCPDGFTNEYTEGQCCPINQPYYYNNTCNQCPFDRPHYYIGNGADEPADHCHYCPQEGPNFIGGQCCANEVDPTTTGSVYMINAVNHICSVCQEGYVYVPGNSNGPCVSAGSIYGCQYDADTGGCQCNNGVAWNPAVGNCDCDSTNYQNEECACQKCINNAQSAGTYAPAWIQTPQGRQCGCFGRIFVTDCCDDPTKPCCVCPNNTIETSVANTPNNSGCCPSARAYNTATNGRICCPEDKPYFNSEYQTCAKCPANQWYDTRTNTCKDCQSPKVIGGWNSDIGAYTTCSCPPGTGPNGAGDPLPYTLSVGGDEKPGIIDFGKDSIGSTTKGGATTKGSIGGSPTASPCKCLTANTQWNEAQGRCVCKTGYTMYGQDNVTVSSCCPTNQYHNGSCCPDNTIWNETLSKCVACTNPTTQIVPGCTNCPDIMVVNTASTNWDESLHGYKSPCICPEGAGSTHNSGDYIQYSNHGSIANSSCRCPSGQHFTDDNYYAAVYSTNSNTNVSCKACPAGSQWVFDAKTQKYHCQCQGGFTLQNGQCECSGGKHSISTSTLSACNPSVSTDCVCAACPARTTWAGYGCKCDNTLYNFHVPSDLALLYPDYQTGAYNFNMTGIWMDQGQFTNQQTTFYNSVSGEQGISGYCVFVCPKPAKVSITSNTAGGLNELQCGNCTNGVCYDN